MAVAIGRQLRLPVATWSVRKVTDPLQTELAIGATSAGKAAVWRDGQATAPAVDQLEILALVEQLQSVGMWYETLNQLADREVLDLLAAAKHLKHPTEIIPCP